MKKLVKPFITTLALIAASATFVSCSGGKKEVDDTLRIPMIADAKTLDPALVPDLYSHYVTSVIYEGLVEYHYLKRPHELVPNIAESMPTVSKDGLTYTFKIRPGVLFTDHAAFPNGKGRAVNAKDFVYSFLRVADPKFGSPNFWVFDTHIVGLNEWREKQKSAATVDYDHPPEGFKAVDDMTLQIKLTHKFPQLLYVLAMPTGAVVPREVVEKLGKDFVNNPVGTGPYKFVSWIRNSKITLEKNPTYRTKLYPSEGEAGDAEKGLLADAGKQLPFAPKLEFQVFVESQPAWLNFLKGNIDLINIPKDNYSAAIDSKTKELLPEMTQKGIVLEKVPQTEVSYHAFNMEDPVIKKAGPNLRKAIGLVQDHMRAIDLFFNGRAIPAQFVIPPGIAGYDPEYKNPYLTHDVEKAKEYLAKAGYPNGQGLPELVYETTNSTESRQMAELLQKELSQIGIKLRVNYNQFAELDEKLTKKKAQMWGIAWNADYPDAENFLQLLYGPNGSPGPNASNFNHPEFNKLFGQVREMADSPARRALIVKMRKIFEDEMPWVPERHRVYYYLHHKWLKNFKREYMGGSGAQFQRVDLESRRSGF